MTYESKAAERSLIGAVLINNDTFPVIASVISHEDFAYPEFRRLWAACEALYRRREPIDHVTLGAELGGELGSVGGPLGLASLTDGVTTTAHVEGWARAVRDASTRRKLQNTCADAVASIGRGEQTSAVVGELHARLCALAADTERQAYVTVSEGLSERLEEIVEGSPNRQIIPTGFGPLDRATGGLTRSLLHVLGGRPGMGKSTFLINLSANLSLSGKTVVYFSLEDSAPVVRDRMISRFSGVELRNIVSNNVLDDEIPRIMQASAILSKVDCKIYDGIGDAESLSRMAIAEHTRQPIDVIMVDHLGYALGSGTPYEASSTAVRAFARLAKETGAAVLLACQLNRQVLSQSDKRPTQKDLRDSGKIEEDARQIWFLHRESVFDDEADSSELELIVAKASNGKPGIVRLYCDLARMYISDPGS